MEQGPVDLYRGLSGAVFGTVPVALVYFATYENCKTFLEDRGISGAAAHLSSASIGAVLSAFIRVPTDTLKHRTQAYITPNILVVHPLSISSLPSWPTDSANQNYDITRTSSDSEHSNAFSSILPCWDLASDEHHGPDDTAFENPGFACTPAAVNVCFAASFLDPGVPSSE